MFFTWMSYSDPFTRHPKKLLVLSIARTREGSATSPGCRVDDPADPIELGVPVAE